MTSRRTQRCPWCSGPAEWVGYSARAMAKLHPSKDVLKCVKCCRTYRYARNGRHMPVRKFCTDNDFAHS
jgi:hypothetical protein